MRLASNVLECGLFRVLTLARRRREPWVSQLPFEREQTNRRGVVGRGRLLLAPVVVLGAILPGAASSAWQSTEFVGRSVDIASRYQPISEKQDQGLSSHSEEANSPGGFRLYWQDGVNLESPHETFWIRLGGRVQVDAGAVDPDRRVERSWWRPSSLL